MKGKFLDVEQVAERLGLSRQTIYKLIQEGKLPSVRLSHKILRIPVSALDKLESAVMPVGWE